VIHQTGVKNFEEIKMHASVILENQSDLQEKYHPYPYLNPLALRMCAGVATLVVSRAGASSIAEIAWWGAPSIVIPITDSNGDHQRKNAFSYSSTGAASVIEEKNLTPQIFLQEVRRIIDDSELQSNMKKATELSRYENAAKTIASELISIGFKHEN
jgi:UDP-N-acetylglucosamine--N-acetylmuramyl-(pentapeptide) pyrophosphoryl-undecaprenol N-acetylglucosamine transferase